ncbi:MAG TPA: sulfatase-like hydrolase/transferase [Bryobacteraceae bacterium]|nr:sulfatase-like hydrolase/transferase [Bryobacteraceae bacterium]
MTSGERAAAAMTAGAGYLALLVTIQAGDFYGYLLPAGAWTWSSAGYLFTLPFIESQNIAICALLAALTWLCTGLRQGRWAAMFLFAALALFSLADQVYYKVFLDHIHLSLFEDGGGFNPKLLLSSFARERDGVFWTATAVALGGSAVLFRALSGKAAAGTTASGRRVRLGVAGGAVLFLAGMPAFSATQYFNLNQNPVWSFVRDWQRGNLASALEAGKGDAPAEAGPGTAGADRDPRMLELAAGRRAHGTKPNVILIVLESTGEENLFDAGGRISPAVTPVIAGLAAHGLVFDDIYAPIPASVRSLISLHTGGRDVGLGGAREMKARFHGQTLPGEFRKLGYKTAFISSQRLDGEYADIFLGQLGFDYLYDFASEPSAVRREHSIHSWGAQELYTMDVMRRWIGDYAPLGPFLVEYYTAATHHPYGAPKGFPEFAAPGEPHNDYLNALHYSDSAIGQLLTFLKEKGLLENTVIAITGDHGEAFGDKHARNRLHREFIYEENVRDFLIVSDPANMPGGMSSHRLGGNGDVMPTLLDYAAGVQFPPNAVPGRDLMAETLEQPPVYFYKMASPEKWGLRDGKWKYISEMRDDFPELYDLSRDPDERENVASAHPELTARYRVMCRRWMMAKTAEYRRLSTPE